MGEQMCGIAGLIGPSVQRQGIDSALAQATLAIGRRGPDATSNWRSEKLLLVHTRLAIIDLDKRSNQPMESKRWVLCYNGEIYNFRELRSELERLGHAFQTMSDTETLLLALEEWGIDRVLSRIAGMFAFIAYDKASGFVYAARDHLGIKPLVYGKTADGSIAIASNIPSVQALVGERQYRANAGALASYFILGGAYTLDTCVEGILRLDAAHCLEISPDGNTRIFRYWSPQFQDDFRIDDLVEIVAQYVIADVPSALFLSGGVDSSFLACVIKELDCFHLSSPEEAYAQTVADRLDRKLIRVEPDLEQYEKDHGEAIAFHGEPLMSVGIPLAVSRKVREHGFKMSISANGADELFLGYARTPSPEYTAPYLPVHDTPSVQFLSQQLRHIFRDRRHFQIPALQAELPSIEELFLTVTERFRLDGFPASASYRWSELMTYVLSDLNPTLDAASMFHSLEVRVPFLDHRIVQGVLSWDASELISPELGRKAPLKKYINRYLPPTFFQREKLGFSIHHDKLATISALGEEALNTARSSGYIHVSNAGVGTSFERDLIYLGNALHGYEKWRDIEVTCEV